MSSSRKRLGMLGSGIGFAGGVAFCASLLTGTPPVQAAGTSSDQPTQPVFSATTDPVIELTFTEIAKEAIKGGVAGAVVGSVGQPEGMATGGALGAAGGGLAQLAGEGFDAVTSAAGEYVQQMENFTNEVMNAFASHVASEGALCGLGQSSQTSDGSTAQASDQDQAQTGQVESDPAQDQHEQEASEAVAQEEEQNNQDEVGASEEAAQEEATSEEAATSDEGVTGSRLLNPLIFPNLIAFLGRNQIYTQKNFQFLAFAPTALDFIGGDSRTTQLLAFLNPAPATRSAARRVEAESFNTAQGFVSTGTGAKLTQSIGSIAFNTVDFGPISGAVQSVHVRLANPIGLGGRFDIHVDSATGPTIASFLAGSGPAQLDFVASVLPLTGKHNVYLTATQTTSLTQPAVVDWVEFLAPPLKPTMPSFASFCMIAQDTLHLDDRVKVSGTVPVQVANSGYSLTDLGTDVVVDNVYSCAPTNMRERSQVKSFLRSEGLITMQNSTKIGGSAIQNAELPMTLFTLAAKAPATKTAITSPEPGQQLVLKAGNYTSLDVKTSATVKLSAGTYYFDDLMLEPQSKLSVDSSAGRVVVNVGRTLTMRSSVVTPNGLPPDLVIGVMSTNAISLSAPFVGTLLAPLAPVSLESLTSGNHSGTFFTGSLTVHQGNAVTCRPFPDVNKYLAAR